MRQLYLHFDVLAVVGLVLMGGLLCHSMPRDVNWNQERAESKRNQVNVQGMIQDVPQSHLDLMNAPRTAESNISIPFMIPPVPGPDEIECFVDVTMHERHGGRCVLLGGNGSNYICQSGPFTELQPNCGGDA